MRTPSPAELAAKVETRNLPAMPAPKVYPSGRVAWPEIVQYSPRDREGVLLDLPPPEAHTVIVHAGKQAEYDLLVATSALQDERHTGSAPRTSWANPHDKPVNA